MRLGLGIRLGPMMGSSVFTPSDLFGAGEAGAFYDPSDLSSMFQDSAGTTPAVINQPVGRINDKSGRGNHATQATTAAKPILRQDGSGFYYLEYDGVDDWLRATFTIAQPWDRVSALQQISWTANDFIFGGGSAQGGLYQTTASPQIGVIDTAAVVSGALAVGASGLVTERHNGASSRIAVNAGSYTTGDTGAATLPNGITIGAQHNSTLAANIRFYGTIMIGRALTDIETTNARSYLAARSGVTL